MENNYVVVKKKNTVWKVLGILLAIGALCVVAAKVYQKFFKNKKAAVCEAEEEDLTLAETEEECDEAEAFEAPAEAVIADSENMEKNAD